MQLVEMMAKACFYAQQHIDEVESWPDPVMRENMLECVSYQMACFFAKNTVEGHWGVSCDVVQDQLEEHPGKKEDEWRAILNEIAEDLGGWKPQCNKISSCSCKKE